MIIRTLLASLLGVGIAHAALPDHMQAITIDHYGGVEVLELHTVAVPELAADEVLIAVHTAGVGPWDADLRAGGIPEDKAKFPMVLGSDGSGTIAAVGTDVHTLHVGQAVYSYSWANPKGGFYAQYAAVAAKRVAPIPKNLSLKEAGAVATTGLTAVQGIDDALHIHQGELLIIHGAQGGVGTLALQLAKLRGARVLATASGADGLALVRKLGADVAVDGRTEDLAAAARRFAPGGADALLALAAGAALDQLRATLHDGALLAYPSGVSPEPRADQRIKVLRYDAIPGVAEFARLNAALESIPVEVPIAAEFPLSAVREAHQRIAAGHLLGKVILNVQ
jgi:NADPH:quinone reductase-like Zn-dependent oxidoreductase